MFKKQKALMCLVFSIVLFCMAVSATEAETTDINAIYVSEHAAEGGTGSIDAPVATLAEAYTLVGNSGTIYLMDTVRVSSTSGDCFIAPAHAGKVTITSADEYNGALDLTEIRHFHFGGDTELNNIGIVANEVVLTADNHVLTMGEGLAMSSPSAAIYRGGHTYCGAKIHLAAYAPCDIANVTCEAAGGELNVRSGEYWSVSAWYGDIVTVTGGETQILLDTRNETDNIWLRYLCPGMVGSSIDSTLSSTDSTVTVIVNNGVNTLEAYRFTKNSFKGSMTANWLIHGSAQGSSYAFVARDFYPAEDAQCTLNVYADLSEAAAKACGALLVRETTGVYNGKLEGDACLADYCAVNGHDIETQKDGRLICIFCGYEQCRHLTSVERHAADPTCAHGNLYETVCTDLCGQILKVRDDLLIDSSSHRGYGLYYIYDPGMFTVEHRCEGCGKLYRTDNTEILPLSFSVKVGPGGSGYSASNPPFSSGNLYFSNFADAMEYVAVLADACGNVTLNIVGNVEVPANYSTPESNGTITITGDKLWFKEAPRRFYMNGDVAFENITFRTNSTTAGMVIAAQNHKLVMGEGIVMGNINTIPTGTGFADCNCVKMYVVGGFEGKNDNVMNTDITIRSGDYWFVGGFNRNASTNNGTSRITLGKTKEDDYLSINYLTPFSTGDGYITEPAVGNIIVDGNVNVRWFYVTTMNKATTDVLYTTNIRFEGDINPFIDMDSNGAWIRTDVRGCPPPYPRTGINLYFDYDVEESYLDYSYFTADETLSKIGATVNSFYLDGTIFDPSIFP